MSSGLAMHISSVHIPFRNLLLHGALAAMLGTMLAVNHGAQAQPFQSNLPYLFNPEAGTGYPGSEIAPKAGNMKGGSAPAIASAIPTAYGADFGDVFSGVAYQRYLAPSIPEPDDGAVFLGVGVGNAQKTVGLEVTYAIYALVEEPFSDGSLSLKVHRQLYEGLAVAVGMESAVRYGEGVAQSAYAVASQTVRIDSGVFTGASATIGVGDGRFNTMSRLAEGSNKASLFGGISSEIKNRVSVFSTWHGQDLNLGASFVVPGPVPVTVTPVWVSVLNKHVSGDRVALSIGMRYQFE